MSLPPALAQALAVASPAIQLVVKASIVLALGGLVTALLGRSSAAIRHWVWQLTFCSLLLLPVSGLFLPAWRLDILPEAAWRAAHTADDPGGHALEERTAAEANSPQAANHNLTTTVENGAAPAASRWPRLALVIWLAGSLFVLGRTVFEVIGLKWMSRRGQANRGDEWCHLLRRFSIVLDIARPVELISSSHIAVPVTFGLLHPVILVPAAAADWSDDKKRMVVLHELAHVKRLDYLSNMMTALACAVYWIIPWVWMAARQQSRERERASDDRVLLEGICSREYASQLLDIAGALGEKSSLAQRIPAMVRHGELKDRLTHVLARRIRRHTLPHFPAMLSVALMLAMILPMAVMQLGAGSRQRVHPAAKSEMTKQNPALLLLNLNSHKLEQAMARLTSSGSVADIDDLAAALQTRDEAVTVASLLALGEIGARRSFYSVIPMLKDHRADVRIAALAALGGIACDPAFVATTASLRDDDARVREMAARSLARLSYKPVHMPIQQVLFSYGPSFPGLMHRVLGPVENLSAIQYLQEALSDTNPSVRAAAAAALDKMDGARALNTPKQGP